MAANQPSVSPPGTGDAAVLRIIDANRNRCLEGLRVVEDYLRFVWDDRHLVSHCKQMRHELVGALLDIPAADLHLARETLRDVGTAVSTPSEYQRGDLSTVVAANWSRVQQALRALEEYTKVLAPQTATRLEALRYRAYTVERAVTVLHTSAQRLAAARLYVLVDGRPSADAFRELVERLLEGGVDVLQLRDKRLGDRELLGRAHTLRELTMSSRALFIMNDRVDLAALAHADGVHLGQEEIGVKEARAILGTQALVGISTHTMDQARQAVLDGASYLGCGPTFPSQTKQFAVFPGVQFLRQVSAEIQLPAFAVGGIGAENLSHVLAAGFARVAVSHSVIDAPEPALAARQLKARLEPSTS